MTQHAATHPGKLRQTLAVYALLLVGAALFLIPFGILISNSLKTDREISDTQQLLPSVPQWGNYPEALEMMGFWPALANTTVITTLCVVAQVLSSSMIGFGFARYRFRGRGIAFAIMLATMMLPAQVTMIPVFLLFRSIGAIDSFIPLILPNLFGAPFFIFMFRQFFLQVPEELLEAARIDGASAWMIYWRIMLPLSTPVIAIVAIYTFMFTWNDFMAPLIYLNSQENRTLAIALNAFSGQYGVQYRHLLMAASFVTMLPCILLFFAAQRFFIDTGSSTGLKG
ncbi:MAG: carbohydrate ABC transporter permease [Phycisphaeraceae bacterium]